MPYIIYFIIYILGVLSFCLWDACIGWGATFDGYQNPPLVLVAFLWFISIPILLMYNFVKLCNYIKDTRIERQEKEKKQRIQEEKRATLEAKKCAKEIEDAFLELESEEQLIEDVNILRKKNK
jgi:small-conductance mechanosensitive channel